MKNILFSLLMFMITSQIAYPQGAEENIRLERRVGVSFKLMGTTWPGGIAVDAFIIPQLNVEFNFTYLDKGFYAIGGGLKYHPFGGRKTERTSHYIGIDFASGQYDFDAATITKLMYIAPLGLNYIGHRGFNFAIDIGAMFTDDKDPFFMFSLKFGYRFRKLT